MLTVSDTLRRQARPYLVLALLRARLSTLKRAFVVFQRELRQLSRRDENSLRAGGDAIFRGEVDAGIQSLADRE